MNLLHDLRRRRVFRLAGLYIVGAWVVIQVAEALFQAWGIPETANRFVFIAAALCFPIALVFGWVFDITSEGIVRTKKAGADESVSMQLQKADYAILAALVAIGVVVVLGSFERIQEEIESGHVETVGLERRANSIAVLPFKNLDLNDPSGFFSIGVTEEILHRLSSLGALHVLASTSSFSFRDSDRAPAEISAQLGVSYLLDGSIRRSDDTVRVTARLLDGDGFQVWSQTFDRELEEIFLVQTDIARAVSQEIVDEIVPLADLPAGRTTENMEAYNAYLLGRYEAYNRIIGWKARAREAFEKAIELDPEFAPPYAGLANLVVNTDRGPQWEQALDDAAKSLELDPDLAEGHAVTGLVKFVLGDPAAGQASLERAIELDPSLSTAYSWLANALRDQGQGEAAAAVSKRGLEIDPFNTVLVVNAAIRESYRGNFERAEQLWLRLISLPQLSGAATSIVDLYDVWGRYDAKLNITRMIMDKVPQEDAGESLLLILARTYAKLGMTEDADYWQARAIDRAPGAEQYISDAYYLYRLYSDNTRLEEALNQLELPSPELRAEEDPSSLGYGAMAQVRVGNYEVAVDWFDRAFGAFYRMYDSKKPDEGLDVELFRFHWPDTLVFPIALSMAHAYQQVGRDADASVTLRRVGEGLDNYLLKDPESLEFAALHRALSGEIDASYEFLQAAVDIGWANYYAVANDPTWASALQDERIAALLEIAKDRVREQRATVEAWQADEDFRGAVERWLSR